MLKIAIIIGSTRPNRNGKAVGDWTYKIASKRNDAEFELIDLKTFNLPLFDEPVPPAYGQYNNPHTKAWASKIEPFDAFIFITPEYNHAPSSVLKNAIDYLYHEWTNKAAGFVSYGVSGGQLAIEHLRLIMAELQVADVRNQVNLSLASDFQDYHILQPRSHQEAALHATIDQVILWGSALKPLRAIPATS